MVSSGFDPFECEFTRHELLVVVFMGFEGVSVRWSVDSAGFHFLQVGLVTNSGWSQQMLRLGDLALRPFGLLSEPELEEISGSSPGFLLLASRQKNCP